MPRLGVVVVGLILAIVLSVERADAQDRVREGFWGSIGGGAGFNLTENSEGERLSGFVAFARGGWALNQRWLVGGDAIGWFGEDQGADLRRGFLGGTLLFYPGETGGFYFKGGIGGAYATVSAGTVTDGTTWGLGTTLGFGYDIRLSDSLNLTLGADWLFQDVNVSTQSNNQLGMLTAAITFF
jgi:hypothetical protein